MNDLAQLMLDHSASLMLLVEPRTLRIVGVNRAVEQLLGYPKEQLLAMAITDIDSALQDLFYWEDVRGGRHADIESQEGQYRRADGELLAVSKSVRALTHDGAVLMLVSARDVQHEHKLEDVLAQTLSQLQATLESTGNGILVIDWHGRIASMNRLFSRMWAIPQNLLDGQDDAGILDHLCGAVAEGPTCRARLQQLVDERETVDRFHLASGRVFECTSRPQRLGERIIGRVFGFNDITQREQDEAALRESRDELEARVVERTAALQTANATLQEEKAHQEELIGKLGAAQMQLLQAEKMASVGLLAAGVAHEINNPIAFVSTNVGTLQVYARGLLKLLEAYEAMDGALAAPDLARVDTIRQEIDAAWLREDIGALLTESMEGLKRVKSIVQDLKDFSHVSESQRQWANVERGLDSTLNLVANDLKYKADVVKDYAGVPEIECLPSQLNQVFMNLMINAGHAIAERGLITVRTGFDAATLWVEIEDSGAGIAPEHLSRIFEPFFTTKPVGKGTGLGLSLSYGIVRKHGGTIEVRSEPGQGSLFRVTLPRRA